jgi:hypothetical protein
MTSIQFETNELTFNDSKSMHQLDNKAQTSKTGSRNRSQSVSSISCKDQFDLSLSSIEQASLSSSRSNSPLNKTQTFNKLADKINFSNNCDSTSMLTKRQAYNPIDNSFSQSSKKHNELHISTDESSQSSSRINKRNKKSATKAFDLKDLILKASSIATRFNAKCISKTTSISHGAQCLRFICQNGHNFYLTTTQITWMASRNFDSTTSIESCLQNHEWCSKCKNFFTKTKTQAEMTNLTVIGGLYENSITLRCNSHNHKFNISYQKKLCQLNCQSCRLHDKNLRKEELIQEDIAQAKQNELHQQKMFEDARRKMDQEMRSSSNSSSSSSSSKRCNNNNTSAWRSDLTSAEREYDFQAEHEQEINQHAK